MHSLPQCKSNWYKMVVNRRGRYQFHLIQAAATITETKSTNNVC